MNNNICKLSCHGVDINHGDHCESMQTSPNLSKAKVSENTCKCECHALGENYPCSNPNCQPDHIQEDLKKVSENTDWEEIRSKIEAIQDTTVVDFDRHNSIEAWREEKFLQLIRNTLQDQLARIEQAIPKKKKLLGESGKLAQDWDCMIEGYNMAIDEIRKVLKDL